MYVAINHNLFIVIGVCGVDRCLEPHKKRLINYSFQKVILTFQTK